MDQSCIEVALQSWFRPVAWGCTDEECGSELQDSVLLHDGRLKYEWDG